MNLAAIGLYDSSAIGDCPAAGTGVSCCTLQLGLGVSLSLTM